jgi:hypothetical protein
VSQAFADTWAATGPPLPPDECQPLWTWSFSLVKEEWKEDCFATSYRNGCNQLCYLICSS